MRNWVRSKSWGCLRRWVCSRNVGHRDGQGSVLFRWSVFSCAFDKHEVSQLCHNIVQTSAIAGWGQSLGLVKPTQNMIH